MVTKGYFQKDLRQETESHYSSRSGQYRALLMVTLELHHLFFFLSGICRRACLGSKDAQLTLPQGQAGLGLVILMAQSIWGRF